MAWYSPAGIVRNMSKYDLTARRHEYKTSRRSKLFAADSKSDEYDGDMPILYRWISIELHKSNSLARGLMIS